MSAPAFAAGLLLGLISGLVPGLHSNTVISILDSLGIRPEDAAVMVIALYPASIIASFLPSVFLGIPEEQSAVSALAGQRMAMQGRGMAALRTMLLSAVLAALLSCAVFFLSAGFYESAYSAIRPHVRYVLLFLSALLILRSRNPPISAIFFILSGVLGKFTLDSGLEDPFLPLFGGMFALCSLLNSAGGAMPKQKEEGPWLGFPAYAAAGALLGMLSNLLPGIGSSAQIAALASIFIRLDTLGYLSFISAVSVSQAVFSLSSAESIGKARNGAVVFLSENSDIHAGLGAYLALFVLSAALASVAVYLLRRAACGISGLTGINIVLALYIAAVTLLIDGPAGLGIMLASAALGTLSGRAGAERINLMGAIIIPTLMLLFGKI